MLARLIAQEHHNVFIVGDPDQAIYGWRGAELRNILDFQKVFPNTRRIDLDTAYRSAAPLLEAAQRMIGHNRERLEHPL
ncbi:MAG: UvrD-helicase domain-containing protein, partial [Acidobacteria bacterium]|nr:UvrD-helicase domain-containing protein [Acidobacteriota bacterium]